MQLTPVFASDEKVGRGLARSTENKARNEANVRESLLYSFNKDGSPDISVDRISIAKEHGKVEQVADYADNRIAVEERHARKFQGWAKFKVADVRRIGLGLVWTPRPGNDYHSNMVLPEYAVELEDVEGLIQELLDVRCWCPYPAP